MTVLSSFCCWPEKTSVALAQKLHKRKELAINGLETFEAASARIRSMYLRVAIEEINYIRLALRPIREWE
jgi:hypothetical protein